VKDRGGNFGPAHVHSASELPWTDHEEQGKWFVKIGDDFRWYLGPDGQVQAGAHWFDDRLSAQRAIEIYQRS
jgi:hypothetical protein